MSVRAQRRLMSSDRTTEPPYLYRQSHGQKNVFATRHLRVMGCVGSFCRVTHSLSRGSYGYIAFRCFRFASDWSGSLTRWMRDMFQLHAVHFAVVMSAFGLRCAINERINKMEKIDGNKTSVQHLVSTFCNLRGEIPNWNVAVLWQLDDASSNVFQFSLCL